MCLVLLAVGAHPRFPLVVLANRDEFYARPTAPADFWPDHPNVLAGRDLQSGGTWLGVTRAGRLALVTNYRQGLSEATDRRSRGLLVSDFLTSSASMDEYLSRLEREADRYAGFNLVFGGASRLAWFSNRGGRAPAITPGVHGLSNRLLDVPWPKVERGTAELERVLTAGDDPEALLAILRDTSPAPDDRLPDTGIGRDLERALSPLFIRTPRYGTRCSTLARFDASGGVVFVERTFPVDGGPPRDRRFELRG